MSIDEAAQMHELKDFAGSGRYPTVTIPSSLFLHLANRYEDDAPDRAALAMAREIGRLAVRRGWSKKEFRQMFEDAYSDAIAEVSGTRGLETPSTLPAPAPEPADG